MIHTGMNRWAYAFLQALDVGWTLCPYVPRERVIESLINWMWVAGDLHRQVLEFDLPVGYASACPGADRR